MKINRYYVCGEELFRSTSLEEAIKSFLEMKEVNGSKALGIEYSTEEISCESVDILVYKNGVYALSDLFNFHHREYHVSSKLMKGMNDYKLINEQFKSLLDEIKKNLSDKITIGEILTSVNKILKDNFEEFKKEDRHTIYFDKGDIGPMIQSFVNFKKPMFCERNNIIWTLNYEKNIIKFRCRSKNTGNNSWDGKALRTIISIELNETSENIERYIKKTPYEIESVFQ